MRFTLILNATRRNLKPTIQILPPIPLYRAILKAHRQLPSQQRVLGDEYVKSEFHAHKVINDPVQTIAFLSSWQNYLHMLEEDKWKHAKLDMKQISTMSDDQLIQLYELMQAARNEKSVYTEEADYQGSDVEFDKPISGVGPDK